MQKGYIEPPTTVVVFEKQDKKNQKVLSVLIISLSCQFNAKNTLIYPLKIGKNRHFVKLTKKILY